MMVTFSNGKNKVFTGSTRWVIKTARLNMDSYLLESVQVFTTHLVSVDSAQIMLLESTQAQISKIGLFRISMHLTQTLALTASISVQRLSTTSSPKSMFYGLIIYQKHLHLCRHTATLAIQLLHQTHQRVLLI